MIKIEHTEVMGFEPALRGMRNPMNSWDRADSIFCKRTDCAKCELAEDCGCDELDFTVGKNDYDLAVRLASNGSVHAKYRRMIAVYTDITAPLYWWKEFDTYKVGTVANSCSTMHKIQEIQEKEFTLEDFSVEHLFDEKSSEIEWGEYVSATTIEIVVRAMNHYRQKYIDTGDKKYWWQMIQLLPSSYNQKRTVMMNYEVLAGIYIYRKDHKLDEWRDFCKWIETLPYSEVITLKEEVDTSERP